MIIIFSALVVAGVASLLVGGVALQAFAVVSTVMFAVILVGGLRSLFADKGREAVKNLTRQNILNQKKNAARDKSVSV